MNNPTDTLPKDKRSRVSAVPYAVFVPILVVFAQSVWASQHASFRHNALLAWISNPVVLCGMALIALVSYFIIRPHVERPRSRWVAFLSCAFGFTFLLLMLIPTLAE